MRAFTYIDFLFYSELINKNFKHNYLSDVSEKYVLENTKKTHAHDHMFKRILSDKKEVVDFLNSKLKLKGTKDLLNENDIEEYKRDFITYDFDNMYTDIIYRVKNRQVFFLIEHQSTIDYSMPYRILKYNMAIMDSAVDSTKVKNKSYRFPIIFSFVIYTGNKKWDATNYILEKQEKFGNCNTNQFANFEVVDINEYSIENLLNSDSVLSIAFLVEKIKNIDEFLEKIMQSDMNTKQKKFLIQLIKYILRNRKNKNNIKIEQKLKTYLEKLEEKKGGKIMFIEMFNNWLDEMEEKEEYLEQKEKSVEQKEKSVEQKEKSVEQKEKSVEQKEKSVKEKEKALQKRQEKLNKGRDDIIIKMIKNNINDSTIIKLTDIKKSELIKIKKENKILATN